MRSMTTSKALRVNYVWGVESILRLPSGEKIVSLLHGALFRKRSKAERFFHKYHGHGKVLCLAKFEITREGLKRDLD